VIVMNKDPALLLLACLAAALPACAAVPAAPAIPATATQPDAQPAAAASLSVTSASIRPAPAGQFETWAWATLDNNGPADSIIEVQSADAEQVVLRAAIVQDAGRVARSVAAIPVPAHGQLVLSPDSHFFAFIKARHPFVPGGVVKGTLRFRSGARLDVEFRVADNAGD
jgi:copper(I)-binding protein